MGEIFLSIIPRFPQFRNREKRRGDDGFHAEWHFSLLDDNTVGADDSVGPLKNHLIIIGGADRVVRPYERLLGNTLCVCIALIEYDLAIIPKNPRKITQKEVDLLRKVCYSGHYL